MHGRTQGLLDLEVISDSGGLGLRDALLAVDGALESLEGGDAERHLAAGACKLSVAGHSQTKRRRQLTSQELVTRETQAVAAVLVGGIAIVKKAWSDVHLKHSLWKVLSAAE